MPREFQHPERLLDLEMYLSSPVIENKSLGSGATRTLQEGSDKPGESGGGRRDPETSFEDFIPPSEMPPPRPQTESEVAGQPPPPAGVNNLETCKLQFGDGLVCLWSDEMYHRTLGNKRLENRPTMWQGNWNSRDESNYDTPLLSLDDCLDELSQIETLSGEQAWSCPGCDNLVPAQTSLHLWRVPEILILQLKRFDPVRQRKVDIFVDYPIKNLDLTDRVGDTEWLNKVSKGERLTYDLFAVGKHSGGLYGGHYTADVYNYLDRNWYDFNGSPISQAKLI